MKVIMQPVYAPVVYFIPMCQLLHFIEFIKNP